MPATVPVCPLVCTFLAVKGVWSLLTLQRPLANIWQHVAFPQYPLALASQLGLPEVVPLIREGIYFGCLLVLTGQRLHG